MFVFLSRSSFPLVAELCSPPAPHPSFLAPPPLLPFFLVGTKSFGAFHHHISHARPALLIRNARDTGPTSGGAGGGRGFHSAPGGGIRSQTRRWSEYPSFCCPMALHAITGCNSTLSLFLSHAKLIINVPIFFLASSGCKRYHLARSQAFLVVFAGESGFRELLRFEIP